MKDKQVINWQFVDKYYDYLNLKIQRIDYYLSIEEHEFAFKEISQIFYHIHAEIKKNDKTKPKYENLVDNIKIIMGKIRDFNILEINHNIPAQYKLQQQSALKFELDTLITTYYMDMMEIISDLNMFFPKVRKSDKLPIYQQ